MGLFEWWNTFKDKRQSSRWNWSVGGENQDEVDKQNSSCGLRMPGCRIKMGCSVKNNAGRRFLKVRSHWQQLFSWYVASVNFIPELTNSQNEEVSRVLQPLQPTHTSCSDSNITHVVTQRGESKLLDRPGRELANQGPSHTHTHPSPRQK